MPYDQKENPIMDVSGSGPVAEPTQKPSPAPKDLKVDADDASITKLAYALNTEKTKLQEENHETQGSQPGFSKADCEDIVDSE